MEKVALAAVIVIALTALSALSAVICCIQAGRADRRAALDQEIARANLVALAQARDDLHKWEE
jgi:hypothetical protein